MYIVFDLPDRAIPRSRTSNLIVLEIEHWAQQYGVKYKIKVMKNTLRVILPGKHDYTMFGLTYKSRVKFLDKFRFVEPMSNT
jgi:hypothetical protein